MQSIESRSLTASMPLLNSLYSLSYSRPGKFRIVVIIKLSNITGGLEVRSPIKLRCDGESFKRIHGNCAELWSLITNKEIYWLINSFTKILTNLPAEVNEDQLICQRMRKTHLWYFRPLEKNGIDFRNRFDLSCTRDNILASINTDDIIVLCESFVTESCVNSR